MTLFMHFFSRDQDTDLEKSQHLYRRAEKQNDLGTLLTSQHVQINFLGGGGEGRGRDVCLLGLVQWRWGGGWGVGVVVQLGKVLVLNQSMAHSIFLLLTGQLISVQQSNKFVKGQ